MNLFSVRLYRRIRPLIAAGRAVCPPVLWQALHRALIHRGLPDAERYGPMYRPWREPDFQRRFADVKARTLLCPEACWHLLSGLRQSLAAANGRTAAIYELGVYRGGTARLLREGVEGTGNILRLFDTFAGMERSNPSRGDRHGPGAFSDTSLEAVRSFVGGAGGVDYRVGWIPATFGGIEGDEIIFAHVDLDLHDPILASCTFIYPRLLRGGWMVLDDYGYPSTPGARRAIDLFFKDKPERPLILQTGQAIVVKL